MPDPADRALRVSCRSSPVAPGRRTRSPGWSGWARAGSTARRGRAALLADPEGNPFQVTEHAAAYADAGPLAAFRLDSADPRRDAAFWSWLTGWSDDGGHGAAAHRRDARSCGTRR